MHLPRATLQLLRAKSQWRGLAGTSAGHRFPPLSLIWWNGIVMSFRVK